MNEDKKAFLKLPKSATDFPKIQKESFKNNIQVMAAKLRMGLIKNEENGAQGMYADAEHETLESRRMFNGEDEKESN